MENPSGSLESDTGPASSGGLRSHHAPASEQVSPVYLLIDLCSGKEHLGGLWRTDHGLVQSGPAPVLLLLPLHLQEFLFRVQDSFLLYEGIIGIHFLD